MVSLQPPFCDFGWKARDFDLPGVDGKRYTWQMRAARTACW